MDALELLCAGGIIPVVVIDDPASARPLGDALKTAGLPVAEITFRTPAALEALRGPARRRRYGDSRGAG